MFRLRKLRRSVGLLCAGVLIPFFSMSTFAADGEIEEIVVTGSFIKRDSFDLTSPIDVMTEVEIAEQGTPNMGEILRNSTYNYGVESVGNILAANPQLVGNIGANFRGLGERATLTLLNGRRTASSNLSNLYPQIMIERTESLTDGGATLYGTDAVGGVFNIIPKTSFDGLALDIGTNQADDWSENTASLLAGHDGDRGRWVAGFEYRKKDRLSFFDRPEYSLGAASYSSTPWPGNFNVANRDVTGAITGVSRQPDPGCGLNNDVAPSTGDPIADAATIKAAGVLNSRQGKRYFGACRWEFGENFDYMDEVTTFTAAVNFEYDFSDRVSFSGEVMYGRNKVNSRGSPSNPGGRIGELQAIPGENPGNPYRAIGDVNGNGFYDPADGDVLLFAQDANLDGIPDRDPGVDLDGNGRDDVIVSGTDPAGGIAFNEDATIADSSWRPVGYPYVGPTRLNDDRTSNGAGEQDSPAYRMVFQLDYQISDHWDGWTSVLYNEATYHGGGRLESLSAINAGLQGTLLARDPATDASSLAYFNPWTTQNFACVNRDCSGGVRQTDPDQINFANIYDQIALEEPLDATTTLTGFESMVTGDLFELPGGTVQTAFGVNYRDEEFDVDTGGTSNALDMWIGIGGADYNRDRQTTALMGELAFPILDTLDVDISARAEWVNDDSPEDFDNQNWRIGVRWAPVDILALRASFNTSFIAPDLPQLYNPSSLQGLSQTSDPFTSVSAFTARTTGGTATLRPEEADVYNIGFSLDLLDSTLRIDFDYKYFDFTDRIIRPAAQEVLGADAQNAVALGYALTPAGLQDWMASGFADPGIIRGTTGSIQLVTTDQINAQSMEWKGFDIAINYLLPFEAFGQWDIGLAATFVETYDYTSFEGSTIKGAGKRNNNTAAVPPVPEWKANLRLGWQMNNHRVTVYGRYIDGVIDARNGDPFSSNSDFVNNVFFPGLGVTNNDRETLGTYITWDFQYAVSFNLIGDNQSHVQVGLINAFDKEAPPMRTLGGLETSLYDPRGQQWYIRLRQDF